MSAGRRARLALVVMALAGLLLLAWASRQASWVARGRVVGSAQLDVPGGPPWALDLEVPAAGERYLLESTVALSAPARAEVQAAPTYRLTAPDGRRADFELEPLPQARTTWRGGLAEVTTHAWLQPAMVGKYRVELTVLRATPATAVPRRWRLRLAAGAPATPPSTPLRPIGFALAAAAFLGLILLRPEPQSANSPNSASRKR